MKIKILRLFFCAIGLNVFLASAAFSQEANVATRVSKLQALTQRRSTIMQLHKENMQKMNDDLGLELEKNDEIVDLIEQREKRKDLLKAFADKKSLAMQEFKDTLRAIREDEAALRGRNPDEIGILSGPDEFVEVEEENLGKSVLNKGIEENINDDNDAAESEGVDEAVNDWEDSVLFPEGDNEGNKD